MVGVQLVHTDKQAGQVTDRQGLGSADIHDFIDAGKPVCYDNLRHFRKRLLCQV